PLLERVDPFGHRVDGVQRVDLGMGGEELREVVAELADPDDPQRERHTSSLKLSVGKNATTRAQVAASLRAGASGPTATHRATAAPRGPAPPSVAAACGGRRACPPPRSRAAAAAPRRRGGTPPARSPRGAAAGRAPRR